MPSQNTQQQLNYQVNPIILTGGVAAQIPGGALPILSIFSLNADRNTGLGLPYSDSDLDDAFGAFNVLPGGTLVSQSIAKYPFANQWVAANAVIREPITVSVIMDAPMRGPNAWAIKIALMSALKRTLDQHNNNGGTYTVATPAYHYDQLILTALTDNSRGNNSLPQNAWRFDFERPLVALSELEVAQNQFTQKISNQVNPGNLTGVNVGQLGSNPTLAMTIKSAGGLVGGFQNPVPPGETQNFLNYPPAIATSGFPYVGIS
jgi:hypothetical protein